MRKAIKFLSCLSLLVLIGLAFVKPIFNSNVVDSASFNYMELENGSGVLLTGSISSVDKEFYGNSNLNKYVFAKMPLGYNFSYYYCIFSSNGSVFYLGTSPYIYTTNWLNVYYTIFNFLVSNNYVSISSTSDTYPLFYRMDYDYENGNFDSLSYCYERVEFHLNDNIWFARSIVEDTYVLGELDKQRVINTFNRCYSMMYDYSVYVSSEESFNRGYDVGVSGLETYGAIRYTNGVDDTTNYYQEFIKENYVSKSSYESLQGSYDNLARDYNNLNNSDVNLSFTGLLRNVIDYPVTFVKKIFTYDKVSVINGVEIIEQVPYEVLGIEISSLCLGFFALCLTFAIIGIIKKFLR